MSAVTRLPNGLRIVSEPRFDVETVSLGVFVDAGTRDELPGEHGLAHFLEHMAFKGTAKRSAFETVGDIERLGGDINAETSPEATSYTVRMLAEDWQVGLDVLLDLALCPRFHPDDIKLEKDVVCQEIAGALDVPDDRLVDGIGLAAFGDHPLGQPILGTQQSVNAMDAASLRSFRARTYAPQNIIISAAGALDHDALVAAIENQTLTFPAPTTTARTAPNFHPGHFLETRDTYDTHLAVVWQAPAFGAPGSMAHAFCVQMLGGGMTSRLFQSVREEAGLAYAVDAYQMVYGDCGLGVVQTATAASSVAAMKDRLRDELLRFADDVEQSELDSAKRQFRASLAMASESVAGLAGRNARQLSLLGALKLRQTLEQEIHAICLADIKTAWTCVMDTAQFAKAGVGDQRALDVWAQ